MDVDAPSGMFFPAADLLPLTPAMPGLYVMDCAEVREADYFEQPELYRLPERGADR